MAGFSEKVAQPFVDFLNSVFRKYCYQIETMQRADLLLSHSAGCAAPNGLADYPNSDSYF